MEHIGDINGGASTTDLRNENGSYKPFDLEDNNVINKRYGGTGNELEHVEYHNPSSSNLENPISVVYVLKTLFFILVWYTFSTLLTL